MISHHDSKYFQPFSEGRIQEIKDTLDDFIRNSGSDLSIPSRSRHWKLVLHLAVKGYMLVMSHITECKTWYYKHNANKIDICPCPSTTFQQKKHSVDGRYQKTAPGGFAYSTYMRLYSYPVCTIVHALARVFMTS